MTRAPDPYERNLPTKELSRDSRWFRVSKSTYPSPIHYSFDGRYHSEKKAFGVLYLAKTETGALAESICRNAHLMQSDERIITEKELNTRSLYQIQVKDSLKLLELTTPNLSKHRLDARIWSEYSDKDPHYEYGPKWSDHAYSIGFDGILYFSRHKTDAVCLALFDKELDLVESEGHGLNTDSIIDTLRSEFDWVVI